MIQLERHGELAELRIAHAKPLNPFDRATTRALGPACAELEADDAVAGVLVWGGAGRAFSVGGDFEDLRRLTTPEEGAEYLRDIVRSYQAVLSISKPVVAAIDLHAIGQGLQVALLADWRVATERARVAMPELANGMPCPLGARILETLLGRARALRLVHACESLDAKAARELELIEETCADDDLRAVALRRLEVLVGHPRVAFRVTKRIHNARFSRQLEEVREAAAAAHAESYFQGQAERHISAILGEEEPA